MAKADGSPVVTNVKRGAGVAGQYEYTATVQYPGEEPHRIRFVGSAYGGPIVMETPGGHQVFVSARVTERIGSTLSEYWVHAFFAPRED